MYYHSVGEALDDNTRLFGGTRRRFFWKEKQGLVSGNRRSFVFVQNTTCLFGGTRKRLFREKNKGLVCGKRRRFVLIRTGRVSSVEPESVSSVRKRKVWSVGKEGGLFLSEQDVSLRWNQKAFLLKTKERFALWEGRKVCSYQNRTCLFGGTRKPFPSVQKRPGTGKRNQNLRRGWRPPLVRSWTTMLGWLGPPRRKVRRLIAPKST